MPLLRHASRTGLAGVYRAQGSNPATYCGIDLANTDEPAGYHAPQFRIDIERRAPEGFLGRVGRALDAVYRGSDTHEVYARLVVTQRVNQGTNAAVYLGDGVHETNCSFDEALAQRMPGVRLGSFLGPWAHGKNRVYLVVTPQIAGMNKRAEEEHLQDFIRAYEMTLHIAQQAMDAVADVEYGPFDSEEDAREAVEAAFVERLPAPLKGLGMDMNAWEAEYLRLFQKSRDRDSQQWHSFGLERIKKTQLAGNPPIHYLTGGGRPDAGRVYLRITAGVTQIGQHPSSAVITYA